MSHAITMGALVPAAPAAVEPPGNPGQLGGAKAPLPDSPLYCGYACGHPFCAQAREVAGLNIQLAAALDRATTAERDVDQLRTQLAGVSVAAFGGTSEAAVATRGQWGWSVPYQDTLDLRRRFDAARDEVAAAYRNGWNEGATATREASAEEADSMRKHHPNSAYSGAAGQLAERIRALPLSPPPDATPPAPAKPDLVPGLRAAAEICRGEAARSANAPTEYHRGRREAAADLVVLIEQAVIDAKADGTKGGE